MAGKTKEAIVKISQAIDSNPPVTDYYILRSVCIMSINEYLEL